MAKERRHRKNRISYINEIAEDFKEIEENFQTDFVAEKPTNKEKNEIPTISLSDIQAVQIEYEKKLKELERENENLKAGRREFKANEKRLINAIRSESILQGKESPVIGRTRLKKEYNINSKYLDLAIEALLEMKVIERKEVPYSQNIQTYEWKILI